MSSQHKIDTVLKNCFEAVGEGPHWESSYQRLVCVDILQGAILRYDPSTQDYAAIHLGTVGPLTGSGWPEKGAGTLYSLSADHKLRSHLNQLGISNGMDWSGDNSVMYYIDSPTLKVVAFDFNLNNGAISHQRTVASFESMSVGFPDGMCVDAEGKLWVAFYQGSHVRRIDPVTGKTLQTIKFPVTNITSCCFGGKNLDELFVTSARHGVSDTEFRERQPLAGSLFRVTGLGVKGRSMNTFKG